jgi:hypothetical protein
MNESESTEAILPRQRALAMLRASWLFRRDTPLQNAREVIGWREARRIPYNLIVGCAGIVTCIAIVMLSIAASVLFGSEVEWPNPPIFAILGVIFYAVSANLCYTGGWITELILRKIAPHESDRVASLSFRLGLILSLLLTLSPAILIGSFGFFKLIHRLTHRG